ncbi:putative minor capsid protein [Treponema lecithinolyticum]
MITPDLLVHSATVYTVQGMDADRKTVWDSGVELSRVRITTSRAHVLTDKGFIRQDKALLFFDCATSQPVGFVPKEGQCLDWNGQRYTVREVTSAYALDNNVEFYKVALV